MRFRIARRGAPYLSRVRGRRAVALFVRRRSSRRWRRLFFHLRQRCVDLGPVGRGRRPDCHRRLSEIRIVERADSHEDQMRPRLGLAEERCSARRAESPLHLVATVRDASIAVRLSGHREGGSAEASVDRAAARTEILALPAPADACDNWRLRAFPADCPAETSSCDRHNAFQSKEAELLIANPTSASQAAQITQGSSRRSASMGTTMQSQLARRAAYRSR